MLRPRACSPEILTRSSGSCESQGTDREHHVCSQIGTGYEKGTGYGLQCEGLKTFCFRSSPLCWGRGQRGELRHYQARSFVLFVVFVCVCMCNVTHDVAGSGCILERPTLVHSLLIEGIQWKRSCARLRIYTSAAVRSAKPPLLLAPGRPCSAASRLGRGRRYPRPHAPGPSPGSLCVTIRRQM